MEACCVDDHRDSHDESCTHDASVEGFGSYEQYKCEYWNEEQTTNSYDSFLGFCLHELLLEPLNLKLLLPVWGLSRL